MQKWRERIRFSLASLGIAFSLDFLKKRNDEKTPPA